MQFLESLNDRAGPQFSLVFPVYNPGCLIERTWKCLEEFRSTVTADWEFLFICDGCTDDTPKRLRTLTQNAGERVRVLSYERNRGKGYAVRLGLEVARGQWRLFTDVDLAYDFADITRVAKELQSGAEVAIASRVHPQSRIVLPPGLLGYIYRRRLQSFVFGRLVRWLLPIKARDTQAGLKGLSAAAAERVLPRLESRGFEFDCELLAACARLGLEVQEVPVTVRYENGDSTTSVQDIRRIMRKLWTIRRAWREVPVPRPEPVLNLAKREAA